MDEPLCFVHFINALAYSHKASSECCSGKGGGTETPADCSCSTNFFFNLGRAAGRSMGSSPWALRGLVLCDAREDVTSLSQPNFRR